MENPAEPIIVTDTDDLQRKFQAKIFDSVLGVTLTFADRLAVELVEVLRANCPRPAAKGESCGLPYTYFVSYAHCSGFGSNNICTAMPVDRFDDVQMFRQTIVRGNNPYCLKAEDIVILNFILLSGPKET